MQIYGDFLRDFPRKKYLVWVCNDPGRIPIGIPETNMVHLKITHWKRRFLLESHHF